MILVRVRVRVRVTLTLTLTLTLTMEQVDDPLGAVPLTPVAAFMM